MMSAELNKEIFISRLADDLWRLVRHSKRTIERLALDFDINNKTEVKELSEVAVIQIARRIALSTADVSSKYQKIVDLYYVQPNLSHRTSRSVSMQQYSTPAPVAFLAGLFVNADEAISLFEPSAGNGLLTVAADPANVMVNEIDPLRRANLEDQGYKRVLGQDASKAFKGFDKNFDAVLTNPPFGRISKIKFDGFTITALEHYMILLALLTMRDDGKAAVIIGGHNRYDQRGRLQQGGSRFFLNYLHSRYNVVDVININGRELYSRQGTGVRIRLILISGRKGSPAGSAPLADIERDRVINSFEELYDRVIPRVAPRNSNSMKTKIESDDEALALELELLNFGAELGMPYNPASDSCVVLDTVIPDSMGYEAHAAVYQIKDEVGGDVDEYVRGKLDYASKYELCQALSAEQVDAVALAIYNIEQRGQGMIVGDQTGIGKGRVAASIIRYGANQGKRPIFLTEKANLFSDIHRDLTAIGSGMLVPFIVNGRESKTDVKDEDGEIVYQALPANEQERIMSQAKVPATFDYVVGTYSQFNSPEKKPTKPDFLMAISEDTIMILDEAHNASGASNVGHFLQGVLARTAGVVFLSATFAKRADNMPIYAMKTAIRDANMTRDELVDAIKMGGVALQEILASQLVAEGQMLRRERSFEGVEVNYVSLTDKEQEHKAISDNITEILRDIISFQRLHVNPEIEVLDKILAAEGRQTDLREGTSQAGIDNQPFVSKVFNVINQMLFSIKCEAVAERAIARLKEGKKPVIAFANTMGSFIEQMENEQGRPVVDGDTINADFAMVLQKGLDGVLRYTETDSAGNKEYHTFDISTFSAEAQTEYYRIAARISNISTGITISPIDIVLDRIRKAGYSVAEVTGRKYELQFNVTGNKALVLGRKKTNTNDAFRQFNNNEVDVLMINQSGSTGSSAHAIITNKVPKEQVRQRVMIVLQAELDINTEVQKRGRINRTGQTIKPIYDYVNSAIPAEQRLMMMLQKKLKSLDANTTSNQKSSTKILDVPDFLNKFGDRVVVEYLRENTQVNQTLNDPLGIAGKDSGEQVEDAAHKVSGRVAVLSTKMQQEFYQEISERYSELIEYLKQVDEYDLEVEAMDLAAETISSRVIKMGKGGQSRFGDDSILEAVMANVLRKPFTGSELANLLNESLRGDDVQSIQSRLKAGYDSFVEAALDRELKENAERYDSLIKDIPNGPAVKKMVIVSPQLYDEVVHQEEKKLKEAAKLNEDRISKAYAGRKAYMKSILHFFHVGRQVNYPITTFEGGQELIYSVFLGFIIDERKKNPYAPSSIRLRFAISNSAKYIAIPASYTKDVQAIIGASIGLPAGPSIDIVLGKWTDAIKQSNVDRRIRHIITGNLLQAYASFRGKLVSYTTSDGGVKKGILLPEHWNPKEDKNQKVIVPVARALKLVRSLTVGSSLTSKTGVSFFRQAEAYKIVVSSSRSKGGDIFLDPAILEIVVGNNFEKSGDTMVATANENKIEKLLGVLQEKFNDSISISSSQFEIIKNDIPDRPGRKATNMKLPPARERVLPLPPPVAIPSEPTEEELEELDFELELELELELLNFSPTQ